MFDFSQIPLNGLQVKKQERTENAIIFVNIYSLRPRISKMYRIYSYAAVCYQSSQNIIRIMCNDHKPRQSAVTSRRGRAAGQPFMNHARQPVSLSTEFYILSR